MTCTMLTSPAVLTLTPMALMMPGSCQICLIATTTAYPIPKMQTLMPMASPMRSKASLTPTMTAHRIIWTSTATMTASAIALRPRSVATMRMQMALMISTTSTRPVVSMPTTTVLMMHWKHQTHWIRTTTVFPTPKTPIQMQTGSLMRLKG